MVRYARSALAGICLIVATMVSTQPASAAPTLTVPFSYSTTISGELATVEGTFTLTSLTTTTEDVVVTGVLAGTATWNGYTANINDTVTATFIPTCGATQSSVTVDIGEFTFTFAILGVPTTVTVDPGAFTVTVDRHSRIGGLICAVDSALADGGSTTAIRRLVSYSLQAA